MPFVFLHDVFDLALTQQKKNFGGACLCVSSLSWYLNDATELDSLISWGRLFQSHIVEG